MLVTGRKPEQTLSVAHAFRWFTNFFLFAVSTTHRETSFAIYKTTARRHLALHWIPSKRA